MIESADATIRISWNPRRKAWDLMITNASRPGTPHWVWHLHADASVALDQGTGWLLLDAVRQALEAQLV